MTAGSLILLLTLKHNGRRAGYKQMISQKKVYTFIHSFIRDLFVNVG